MTAKTLQKIGRKHNIYGKSYQVDQIECFEL